jgi:predicted urease superfamily metal-dependent hydrolase
MKFTTGEQNLAKKYNLDLALNTEARTITEYNRFGGDSVLVNPLESKTYHTAITLYESYERGMRINVNEADRLKYLLLKLNSEAYQALLD